MSWSLSAIGKAEALKRELAAKFAQAKTLTASIPEEQKTVELAEQMANQQFDFIIANGGGAMQVDCSGSASKSSDPKNWPGSIQVKVDIKTLYGFVE